MERTQKIEEAWSWARKTRLDIIRERRECLASPGHPFEARPGQEEAFEKAETAIFALDTILGGDRGRSRQGAGGRRRRARPSGSVTWPWFSGWRRWLRWALPPYVSQ